MPKLCFETQCSSANICPAERNMIVKAVADTARVRAHTRSIPLGYYFVTYYLLVREFIIRCLFQNNLLFNELDLLLVVSALSLSPTVTSSPQPALQSPLLSYYVMLSSSLVFFM